jgi:DUF1680 family protein
MDSDLYKTLEAIGWELGRAADPGLTAFAAEATSLLAKAQQSDGHLNSCQGSGLAAGSTGTHRRDHLSRSHG